MMAFCSTTVKTIAKRVLPHLCLVIVYFIYLVVGAFIFGLIEGKTEEDDILVYREKEAEIRQSILQSFQNKNDSELNSLLDEFVETVSHPDFLAVRLEFDDTINSWSLPSAMLFCMTTITTIGYGDVAPATPVGKAFCIVYSLFGVPMSFLLFADIGGLLAKLAVRISRYIRRLLQKCGFCKSKLGENSRKAIRIKRVATIAAQNGVGLENHAYKANGSTEYNMKRLGEKRYSPTNHQTGDSNEMTREISYLEFELDNYDDVPFLAVVILLFSYLALGALAFAHSEDWYYGESFYFTFITLTTIGFGDYVPKNHYENNTYIPCMLYTLLGLCYMSMCITLLQNKFVRGINASSKKFEYYINGCRHSRNEDNETV